MAVADQEKTTFTTSFGCYMYTAMTFGLKNGGAMYQRCMTECLKEQIGRNVHVYIDDVVVKSNRTDDLVADLIETFANLRRYSIKLNPEKCVFGAPSDQLLGFVVSKRGIEANPVKISTIQSLGLAKDLKDTQKLAGRVVALSRFIPRLGEKAMPLYRLMQKTKVLSESPLMAAPKPREPMLMYIAA